MLTQKELKELLHYDPDTGVFTWIARPSMAVHSGDTAGSVDRFGYAHIGIRGRIYLAHRLAWLYVYGVWPKDQIDHINHGRGDNRIINLREANSTDNNQNRSIPNINTSGICGVQWHKLRKRWYTAITANGERIYLGCYSDFFEACCARKSAENRHGFHINHGT